MTIEVFLDAYGTLRKVGVLSRHAGAGRERVTYEHDSEWLASPDAFQFDPTQRWSYIFDQLAARLRWIRSHLAEGQR